MPVDTAKLLSVASNEIRVEIIDMLEARGEMTVSEINAEVSVKQSALCQHLGVMRNANVVETRRERRAVYYHLAESAALLELIEWQRRHSQ
ncbi:ArsR/SmtB family transcription factor [Halomonas sp. V046]|uniref:ArsR/SmtB family transcription factor n=1 Tax=Halomonas sp. V046 TaxID=3459611 RepID=UPI004044B053